MWGSNPGFMHENKHSAIELHHQSRNTLLICFSLQPFLSKLVMTDIFIFFSAKGLGVQVIDVAKATHGPGALK